MAGYDLALGDTVLISPYAGFNLSIPLGDLSWTQDAGKVTTSMSAGGKTSSMTADGSGSSGTSDISNAVIPGAVLGVGVGYKFDSHNMLLGDLRYLLDFTAVVSGDADVLTRRGLTSGVNYIYFF